MTCASSDCNMTKTDSNIRVVLIIISFVMAYIMQSWMMLMMGLMTLYTVFANKCFIYRLLGINEGLREENNFLSSLPENNPEPVFVIDEDASILFKNIPAINLFPNTMTFDFLSDKIELQEILNENKLIKIKHTFENKETYQFSLKGVKDINKIMAYGTNITESIKANEEIINIQKDVVYAMGAIGETRSKETGNHVKRVAEYSKILALKYGLDEAQADLLKLASPMHDIGKVGIKDEILNKPGKLTDKEFIVMKTHSTLGYNMLKNSDKPILKAAAIVAHQHHEKWDGSGYPKKLKGEEIHIFGRITAVADVFDALGSDRVYKEAWPLEKIFNLFKEERGKHFDPQLIDLFFDNFEEIDEIRLKYQDKSKK
ncbi:HD-GYP domain-containing protein [Poseidonibacter lekithochrous]|uniref:HD-GYP domain-containing protein n=1 Tax=Poseidonibacter lekithochrous TaxID=1904463 RepID=UPI0008FC3AF7|nr:HD domain-containing phosphohydrolase [Poseidonibacter lekithochrous]QKJ24341.1 response regulator c-di-GMP phosphodiesterase, RpfG family [Poseidonibacter lekithochrous]